MAAGFTYRHYILKDHLGSRTTITDAEGNVEQELSYDAWGNLRDPETWCSFSQAEPIEARTSVIPAQAGTSRQLRI